MPQKRAGLIGAIFDPDTAFMRACEKLLDLVTVNLLFVLTCLPLVTIGIAKISLYQSVVEIRHHRRIPVIRHYLKAFYRNWKLGFQLGMLELVVIGISLFDLSLFWGQKALIFQVIKILCLGFLFFLTLLSLAVYPLAGESELTYKECLQKSLLLVSFHFPWFCLLLVLCLLLLGLLFFSSLTLLLGASFFLLGGFSFFTFLQAIVIERFVKQPFEIS